MKTTININLGGRRFVIDDDAYAMLREYLNTLEHVFSANGEPEVAGDIEDRLAEILEERLAGQDAIITRADVEEVIARIGKPEDFMEVIDAEVTPGASGSGNNGNVPPEIEIEEESFGGTPPPPPGHMPRKRLFRDPKNKMLGGVCSGVAWFLNVDPVWVRLITAALCFASLSVVAVVYLILWIVVPEANTPYERLQMMGEDASVENIGRVVTDDFRSHRTGNVAATPDGECGSKRFAEKLTEILSWVAKGLLVLIGVVCVPVAAALVIGLAGCVFASLVFGIPMLHAYFPQWVPPYMNPGQIPFIQTSLWCGIGWILTIGIPLAVIGWKAINTIGGRQRHMSRTLRGVLITLWVIGFITAAVTTSRLAASGYDIDDWDDWDDLYGARIEMVENHIHDYNTEMVEYN